MESDGLFGRRELGDWIELVHTAPVEQTCDILSPLHTVHHDLGLLIGDYGN